VALRNPVGPDKGYFRPTLVLPQKEGYTGLETGADRFVACEGVTPMPTRISTTHCLLLTLFCSASLLGQNGAAPPISAGALVFPVIMEQGITAGKTPVGTKVQAKLAVATLMEGTVIPRSALFSGEVTESVAKTKTDPSRLAIRMDSVQWKQGSAPVTVYLTSWYYPAQEQNGQDLQYGPQQPASRTWSGQGQYPSEDSKVYRPFPGSDSGQASSVPTTPSATTSNQRIRMKGVESQREGDGAIVVSNSRSNIKLDKLTTYVLAADELSSTK
jgi:hypothetical protein